MDRGYTEKMKILKYRILFIILASTLNSCSGQDHDIQRKYAEAKLKFEKQFVDHFPSKLPPVSLVTTSEDIIISHPGIWVRGEFDKSTLDSIEVALSKKARARYDARDTCLLLIDKHLNNKNWTNFEKSSNVSPEPLKDYLPCASGKLPIPKFWSDQWSETKETEINIDPNYKIYILEAKSGTFWKHSKLPNGKFTPKGWTHGYSKGVAINRMSSTIIFWFDIW